MIAVPLLSDPKLCVKISKEILLVAPKFTILGVLNRQALYGLLPL